MMTIAIGFFVINRYVLLYGGDFAMAAYGAATRIEQVALLPALGLNIAALSLVGQNFGARNGQRIRQIYRLTLRYAVTIMTLGMIIVFPLAPRLIALFNDNPSVIAIGAQFLRIEVIAFNTYVLMGVSNSILQGIKRPKMIFFIGVTRQFILPMIIFPFLGGTRSMGILGVWWGIVLITWTAAIFSIAYTLQTLRKVLGN
jgi:Na+-driven multidrug efflux pump